ncbi:MAG: SprT-like domain-containing protein [Ileibacterium sp.]|nr:SprT-like domain-containing protein [Ileibacterium sp.]
MNLKILVYTEEETLAHEFQEALSVLVHDCQIPLGNLTKVTISNRMSKALGKTIKKYEGENPEYEIRLSSVLLDPSCPKEVRMATIYHELLHTCDHCMNHGSEWQYLAFMVSQKTGLEITRTRDQDELPEEFRITLAAKQITMQSLPKYQIKCTKCDFQTDRKKITSVVRNLDQYRCPECGGELKLYQYQYIYK